MHEGVTRTSLTRVLVEGDPEQPDHVERLRADLEEVLEGAWTRGGRTRSRTSACPHTIRPAGTLFCWVEATLTRIMLWPIDLVRGRNSCPMRSAGAIAVS